MSENIVTDALDNKLECLSLTRILKIISVSTTRISPLRVGSGPFNKYQTKLKKPNQAQTPQRIGQ